MRLARLLACVLAAVLLAGPAPGPTAPAVVGAPSPAASAAPSGPRLSVTDAQLARALTCRGPLRGLDRDPVLLTPAFSTDRQSFGWNYLRALPRTGRTVCSLSLPDQGFGDLQRAAEYDVRAVRRLHRVSGRQVVVLGHQHGALDGRWALAFWPDLARKVSDYVSLATPHRGTDAASGLCSAVRRCPPSLWQIGTGSAFLRALARKGLPQGPGYTSIVAADDEVIVPQPRASTLRGGTTIVVQDLCPGRRVGHFGILSDHVGYRIVLDALTHRGPARASRIPRSACGRTTMPGARGAGAQVEMLLSAVGFLGGAVVNVPVRSVPAEPPLASYAR